MERCWDVFRRRHYSSANWNSSSTILLSHICNLPNIWVLGPKTHSAVYKMCGCELACFSFHKRSYYNVQAVDTAPNYKDISYLCYFAYVLEKDTQSHWIFVSEPKMMVRMKVKVGLYQYRSPSPYILTTWNINYSKVFFL